jgi:hypothetical protein
MEVGYIPRIAMVKAKNNGTLQIDITTPTSLHSYPTQRLKILLSLALW